MASGSKNYFVGPEDGWFQIVDGTTPAITYLKVNSYPQSHTFYIHIGAAAPVLPQVGIPVTADPFWFQGSESQKVFVKVVNPLQTSGGTTTAKTRIDVYAQGGALT